VILCESPIVATMRLFLFLETEQMPTGR